jgi:hypothetical protein
VLRAVAVGLAAGTIGVLALTVHKQQDTIDNLVELSAYEAQFDQEVQAKLWDLHRRVMVLEAEDQRIMAHVRWFVMRRSGTAELRRMEQAIRNLEAD